MTVLIVVAVCCYVLGAGTMLMFTDWDRHERRRHDR